MKQLDWVREKYIYVVVLVLVVLIAATIHAFNARYIDNEAAKVYLQALTAIATLALLYYAYFNVISKKQEEIAHLELAVRPILVWELESKNSKAMLTYKTMKHPIYDLRATIKTDGKVYETEDRHLDVSENSDAASIRRIDITNFISGALGKKEKSRLLHITFTYHSEVGGQYGLCFTKEVVKKKRGFIFQHRKINSAKYPWNDEKVSFV